jgi:nitrogen regulation protein NR(I)
MQRAAKLLIVDDEPNVIYSFRKGLESDSLRIVAAETAAQGIRLVEEERPDAMILDVRLPDMSGLDAFDRIRKVDPRLPVIIITAHGTTETAIDAMKRGAFEYLIKPVDLHQLRRLTAKALELSRLRSVPALFDDGDGDTDGERMVGRSPAMQEVYKTIGRVAAEEVTVLILGESGTGKELAARALYQHSRRSEGPFVAINCAALPEPLLESELFGHERGAFTGAERRRIGKFEQAHGGTIFLDELGDMTPATQAKVLRVLQDGRFERVGGNETIEADVRVIAATNQDLDERPDASAFRRDLLYRLNAFTLRLPPLRERTEDLPLLVEHFLKTLQPDSRGQVTAIAPEAMAALERHRWPGNVRELQSVIKYAVVHAVGAVIALDCLPPSVRDGAAPNRGATAPEEGDLSGVARYVRRLLDSGAEDVYHRASKELDRIILSEVLHRVHGNQVQASERLGIARNTLRTKMSNLGLDNGGHGAGG